MRYEEMTQQMKDLVNAVLVERCSYFIKKCGLVVEQSSNGIALRQKGNIHANTIGSVVDVSRVFDLSFILDTEGVGEGKGMYIKIF